MASRLGLRKQGVGTPEVRGDRETHNASVVDLLARGLCCVVFRIETTVPAAFRTVSWSMTVQRRGCLPQVQYWVPIGNRCSTWGFGSKGSMRPCNLSKIIFLTGLMCQRVMIKRSVLSRRASIFGALRLI